MVFLGYTSNISKFNAIWKSPRAQKPRPEPGPPVEKKLKPEKIQDRHITISYLSNLDYWEGARANYVDKEGEGVALKTTILFNIY